MEISALDPGDATSYEHLYVREVELKGLGLFAAQSIPEGTFIGTYPGELITKQLADTRDDKYTAEEAGCFLFYFSSYETAPLRRHLLMHCRGNMVNENKNQIKLCLDPTYSADFTDQRNYLAMANHSLKQKNLRVEVCVSTAGIPFVCFFASHYIGASTEIQFNYGDNRRCTPPWYKKA